MSDHLRIPMVEGNRSLNLANSAAIGLYEAWRSLGLPEEPELLLQPPSQSMPAGRIARSSTTASIGVFTARRTAAATDCGAIWSAAR